jgi:hypothetical protein
MNAPVLLSRGCLLALMMGSPCFAQDAVALRSPYWEVRAQAFNVLRRDPVNWRSPDRRSQLVGLLERENGVILGALRESDSQEGVSAKYGEEYSEYYASLLETCDLHCDRTLPRTIDVLASSSYSSHSVFAQRLIRDHASRVASVVLERLRSDVVAVRHESVMMLGQIEHLGTSLTPRERAAIHTALAAAAADVRVVVRLAAVATLGEIGSEADIAVLNRIAERDSTSAVGPNGNVAYPVRAQARAAIAQIRKRH